jgi:hypothetical protein
MGALYKQFGLTEESRHDDMNWLDIVAPLMVVGLMGEIFYFIASSEAVRGNKWARARIHFPPTRRNVEALVRLWHCRIRRTLLASGNLQRILAI